MSKTEAHTLLHGKLGPLLLAAQSLPPLAIGSLGVQPDLFLAEKPSTEIQDHRRGRQSERSAA